MKNISINQFIKKSTFSLRWSLSLVLASFVTIIFGVISLHKDITLKTKSLEGLSSHLTYLIDVNDRTEVLRILTSLGKDQSENFSLIVDGHVYATSHDVTLIDTLFIPKEKIFRWDNYFITKNSLTINVPFTNGERNKKAGEITLEIPLKKIFAESIIMLLLIFSLSFIILYVLSYRFEMLLHEALSPLQSIENDIRNLHNNNHVSQKLRFNELEMIRSTLEETKLKLNELNEKYANQKAKEINSEVYRRLVHDLQNPITALKTLISLFCEEDTDNEIRHEALKALPSITDEILLQITAAKKNFEFDVDSFKNIDLRDCIHDALLQIKANSVDAHEKIKYIPPKNPVFSPCNPIYLKRALINLIENATEACHEITEIRLAQNQYHTSIFVGDDGSGIDELKLEKIIAGQATSKNGNRQALGLSSVNHIIKSHSGQLLYQKSKYGGAEFEVRLGDLC
jgi:signal transduction histidine kinase